MNIKVAYNENNQPLCQVDWQWRVHIPNNQQISRWIFDSCGCQVPWHQMLCTAPHSKFWGSLAATPPLPAVRAPEIDCGVMDSILWQKQCANDSWLFCYVLVDIHGVLLYKWPWGYYCLQMVSVQTLHWVKSVGLGLSEDDTTWHSLDFEPSHGTSTQVTRCYCGCQESTIEGLATHMIGPLYLGSPIEKSSTLKTWTVLHIFHRKHTRNKNSTAILDITWWSFLIFCSADPYSMQQWRHTLGKTGKLKDILVIVMMTWVVPCIRKKGCDKQHDTVSHPINNQTSEFLVDVSLIMSNHFLPVRCVALGHFALYAIPFTSKNNHSTGVNLGCLSTFYPVNREYVVAWLTSNQLVWYNLVKMDHRTSE